MNSFARGILMHFRLLYVWDSCLGMQITVKRKCKCALKYIWVYFALRDGIVDLCYKSTQIPVMATRSFDEYALNVEFTILPFKFTFWIDPICKMI